MSINKVECNGGRITLHGDFVVQHQEDVKFELQGDRLPNYLRGSMKGDFFLTASKLIFVNKHSTGKYISFSMEFRSLKNIEVKQPIFGANYLSGFVMAEQGGGWEGNANFKIEFSSGGAIDFAEQLKQTAGQARSGRQPVPQMQTAGYYPPPPLGGYYYAPYQSAYPAQPPPQGAQPYFASPQQAQGAPPPYPGPGGVAAPAPPQHIGQNEKEREAYSNGPNVYVPQYENPPPYAPGYTDSKKNQ
ncbi:WW domain-binding protein 2-like [Rhopilema esculentum]|uniref:WW domain-binding protein 2-like n=1 Tax=Rhopilema esculentum TaxID=499914 RepID=UPI0031CDE1C5